MASGSSGAPEGLASAMEDGGSASGKRPRPAEMDQATSSPDAKRARNSPVDVKHRSAYSTYLVLQRKWLKEWNTELTHKDASQIAARRWHALSKRTTEVEAAYWEAARAQDGSKKKDFERMLATKPLPERGLLGHIPGVPVGYSCNDRSLIECLGVHRDSTYGVCAARGAVDPSSTASPNAGVCESILVEVDTSKQDSKIGSELFVDTDYGENLTVKLQPARYATAEWEDDDLSRALGLKRALALFHSQRARTPVRVVRHLGPGQATAAGFYYDGLYNVKSTEIVPLKKGGPTQGMAVAHILQRLRGQGELSVPVVKPNPPLQIRTAHQVMNEKQIVDALLLGARAVSLEPRNVSPVKKTKKKVWARCKDSKGRAYFSNHKEKRTMWSLPDGLTWERAKTLTY